MANHLNTTKWYIAEVVQECCVENDSRNVVHVNVVLICAVSPEDAFEKAEQLGRESEDTYLNPNNEVVTYTYRGLRNLYVVDDDELEHGTELAFEEKIDVPEEELQEMIRPKSELTLFRQNHTQGSNRPNYACKEIMDEVEKMTGNDASSQDPQWN